MLTKPIGFDDKIWESINNKGFDTAIVCLKNSKDDLLSFFEKAVLDLNWGGSDRATHLDKMVCAIEEESADLSALQCMKIMKLADEILVSDSHLLTVISAEGKEYIFPKLAVYQSTVFREMVNSRDQGSASNKPIGLNLDVKNEIIEIFQYVLLTGELPESCDYDKFVEAVNTLQITPFIERITENSLTEIITIKNDISGVTIKQNSIEIEGCSFLGKMQNRITNDHESLIEKTKKLKNLLSKDEIQKSAFIFSGYITPELIKVFVDEFGSQLSEVVFHSRLPLESECYSKLIQLSALKKLTFSIPEKKPPCSHENLYPCSYENLTDEVIKSTLLKLPFLEQLFLEGCNSITETGVSQMKEKGHQKKLKNLTIRNCEKIKTDVFA